MVLCLITKLLYLILYLCLVACSDPWNNPYPENEVASNVRYSSFTSPPKTLDPAKSYTTDESIFIAQIYEPPIQYHFLKRPYVLVPLTTSKMPEIVFLDSHGQALANNAPDNQVAFTIYTISIRPGIYFQPHPAFAKDANGRYLYHNLSLAEMKHYKVLDDFKKTGTRELTAQDYIYEIKRLATPGINSPIFGLMSNKILGLESYNKTLQQVSRNNKHQFIDLRKYPLAGAKELDRYTYRIIIKGKYSQFLYWLSMSFFSPIPWEADFFYSQPGMKQNNINFDWYPVGTGPYLLRENNPNRKMILEKNPYFHEEYFPSEGEPTDSKSGYLKNAGKRLPFLNKAIYTMEKESIPRWNKFLQGYYDQSAISSDSFDQAIQIDRDGKANLTPELKQKGIYLQTSVALSLFYLGFNMLDNTVGGYNVRAQKLRQAISIAIDYDEYISIFLNGRGIPAQGPLPPGIFGYLRKPQGLNPYVYEWRNNMPVRRSIKIAKQLMREAGYANGIDPKTKEPLILNYDVASTSGPDEKSVLNWMREQFAKIGIELNIRATEYNRFQEKVRTGQAQIFSWGWVADYPDPENFLFLLYGHNSRYKSGGENITNYNNPTFDVLFEQMKNMPNTLQRQKIINQMVAIVRADAPLVWGVNSKTFLLNQVWNEPNKVSDLNSNTLKYQSVNPALREKLQLNWNQRITWPLILFVLIGLLIFLPVVIRYLQKERQSIKKQ